MKPLDRRALMWQPVGMKRWLSLCFSVLSLVFLLAYPRLSLAQQKIAVRSGEHEDYSRVVFDWGRTVAYDIDETKKGLLVIRFKEAGRPDLSQFDPSKLDNVTGFRILQNDPLIVSMIVPEESKVKAFNLMGKRFVVDIYAPEKKAAEVKQVEPQNDKPKKEEASKDKATENKSEPVPVPSKKPESETIAQVKPATLNTEKEKTETVLQAKPEFPHSLPPEDNGSKKVNDESGLKITLIPESAGKPPPINGQPAEPKNPDPPADSPPKQTPDKEHKTEKAEGAKPSPAVPEEKPDHDQKQSDTASLSPLEIEDKREHKSEKPEPAKIKADPASMHVMTVTSTSTVGLSVFVRDGQLSFITDQESRHLVPVINSKTPHIFPPFEGHGLTGGQVYHTLIPADYEIRAKGGELSWKIILDKQKTPEKAIEPERIARSGGFSRGGKLVWPVKDATAIIDLPDPVTGQTLKIVTVKTAEQHAGSARDFVDFTILHSVVGLAIFPKVDDLQVELTEQGIEISRPGGLAILPDDVVSSAALDEKIRPTQGGSGKGGAPSGPKIFNFGEWQKIPFAALEKNTNLVLSSLPQYTKSGRAEDLIALAKAYLLSGMGAEALGFLDFAAQELPEIAKNPEFIALRGMANAFDGKTDVALAYLQRPELKPFEEVGYWKSYILADLGDWQQAINVLPENLAPFYEYPGQVSRRLALILAEVLLRAGRADKADELLAMIEHYKADLNVPMLASLDYLKGESARQKGQKQKAVDTWRALEKGPDDLYRVKAGLAATRLLDEEGAIPVEKAVDRLERLRYAWRGDEIEALVNYWLGHAYFRKKDYVKGLTIMRDSAEVAGETDLRARVTADMRKAFVNLFMGPDLANLTALDAVGLYEQFSELIPPGEDGDKIARKLGEHLVRADLLGRAAVIFENQVNNRLKGDEQIRVAKRLAVVYLLDRQPQKALSTLSKIENSLKLMPPGPEKTETEREITLLRARALAQENKAQQALNLLKDIEPASDVNLLRADISWQAGFWGEAADALQQVLEDQGTGAGDFTQKQAQIVMNLAVALNLANDRIAIANLREKYGSQMAKTGKSHQFEVITRARRNAVLADRETLMSVVSEVDLFKEFLSAYKSDDAPVSPVSAQKMEKPEQKKDAPPPAQ